MLVLPQLEVLKIWLMLAGGGWTKLTGALPSEKVTV
jgi:hypothetical protein